ncbi:MAG: hypothetical protein M1825_002385 [Sarcosagium campestre]|nr:MAG: hypothetical protein M1825_002385 [Sarcosagium campestre]
MDSGRQSRLGNASAQSRKPLQDATEQVVNTRQLTSPRTGGRPAAVPDSSALSPSTAQLEHTSKPLLPHHDSLKADGDVNKLVSSTHAPVVAENPRLSAVVGTEPKSTSNRNSQASTTSTTASGGGRRKTHVGPWRLGKTLGRGATARVRLAKHAITGQLAAVKIISKAAAAHVHRSSSIKGKDFVTEDPGEDRRMPFGIEREVVIMKLIQHEHVIALYDIWENRGELYLVLEYVDGGELFDYIVEVGRLREWEAIRYFRQILSGLTYCHGFNICHRDLKPENILLDGDKNIKIADFGMAALQPTGSLLNTSCGSPHYASPEIVKGLRYHGEKADVWSLGVILFVILTGRLPFDHPNVKLLLDRVKAGKFTLPAELTEQACDLIVRMLEVDPHKRISMDEIWRHPLVTKYKMVYAIDGSLQRFASPAEFPIMDGGDLPQDESEIDGEIFRNLQVLWHGASEAAILDMLLCEEPTQEKFFYCLLAKYREDHLDEFRAPGFKYSASDYHHNKRQPKKRVVSRQQIQALNRNHRRQRSQFSIVSNDAAQPRSSYYEEPEVAETAQTMQSYDPYRASQKQILRGSPEYANITVHHHDKGTGRSSGSAVTAPTARHPAIARLTERQRSRSPSVVSNVSSERSAQRTEHAGARGLESRSSIASASSRGSHLVIVRPSSSHKRPVTFAHPRKGSAGSPAPRSRRSQSLVASEDDRLRTAATPDRDTSKQQSSSPAPDAKPATKLANGTSRAVNPPSMVQKPRSNSVAFKDEARQVSSELEKFCEEAFNRSSVSSSRTAKSTQTHNSETPISSFSTQGDVPVTTKATKSPAASKPQFATSVSPDDLAPTTAPRRRVDSFTAEQLKQTRDRLLARAAQSNPGVPQSYLDDVIAHLEELMSPGASVRRGDEEGRRVISATPDCRSPSNAGLLPAISEEGRFADADEASRQHKENSRNGQRVRSEPLPGTYRQSDRSSFDARTTIRVVEHTSPTPISHTSLLDVKKRSPRPMPDLRTLDLTPASPTPYASDRSRTNSSAYPSNDERPAPRKLRRAGTLRDDQTLKTSPGSVAQKGAWFHKNPDRLSPAETSFTPTGRRNGLVADPRFIDQDEDRETSRSFNPANGEYRTGGAEDTEKPKPQSRFGFRKFFHRREVKEKPLPIVSVPYTGIPLPPISTHTSLFLAKIRENSLAAADLDDTTSVTNSVSSATTGPHLLHRSSFQQQQEQPYRSIQPQQNWLSRFLHKKPATKTYCFQVSLVRARREVMAILRDWKRYGLRDLTLHKQRNVIFGRVDAQNFLGIKPVSFAAELFSVIEHGRRSQISIARFTQEKGASSSFRKVVETLEKKLEERGLLVRDERRVRGMRRALAE